MLTQRKPRFKKPDTIPMPGPDEIIKNRLEKNGKCCLTGWASRAFYGAALSAFLVLLRDEIGRLLGHPSHIVPFNDLLSTPEDRALVWQRAAERFGYSVENKPWRCQGPL